MAITGTEKIYVSRGSSFKSLSVQQLADYAAAEAGDVVSINGVTPNESGEVTLTPASIGAFAANDVSTIGNNVISAPDQATALTAIGALAANGTAAQATKLATARAITLTGNATGTANFDGSAAANIAVTIPTGTESAAGILQIGDGLGLQSPGILGLAAPGNSKLGGIYQPNAATGLDVTNGILTSPGLKKGTTGTTAARPTLAAGDAGYEYFDTTLGKPIWWKGAVWVDSAGANV